MKKMERVYSAAKAVQPVKKAIRRCASKRGGPFLTHSAARTALCVMMAPVLLAAPAFAAPGREAAVHEAVFGFETDRALQGAYGSAWLYFQVPQYWEALDMSAHIEIQLSPLVLDIPADLTFYLNDDPVYSMKIDYADGEAQTVDIPLDISRLATGYNSFRVSGFAKIYDTDGCIDDTTEANWTVVKGDSTAQRGPVSHQPGIHPARGGFMPDR